MNEQMNRATHLLKLYTNYKACIYRSATIYSLTLDIHVFYSNLGCLIR